MTEDEFKTGKRKPPAPAAMVALKDFHIFQPPHADIRIKVGDDVSKNVPEKYHANLKTEGVIQ